MSSQYKIMDENRGATLNFGSFRFNVKKVAVVIASINFVFSVLGILSALLDYFPSHRFNIAMAFMNLFWAFVYLGIIEGVRSRKTTLFLPYLILTGISLAFNLLCLIGLVVIGIWAPQELVDKWNEMYPQYKVTREEFREGMLLYSLLVGIFFAFGAWCYSVIYRAYKGLKNALKESILAI